MLGSLVATAAIAQGGLLYQGQPVAPGFSYRRYSTTRTLRSVSDAGNLSLAESATHQIINYPLAHPFGDDDNFYVRVEGLLRTEEAGRYSFLLTSDDGAKLSIAGRSVAENDGLHPAVNVEGSISLNRGLTPFVIEYFEGTGDEVLRLEWKRQGDELYRLVPEDAFFRINRTQPPAFRALVFTKTAGYRHGSIADGVQAIKELGAKHGFAVDHTEDASLFTAGNLTKYRVAIWLNTTGDVLNDDQQRAFRGFVETGGGFVGIHAAADTEYDWPWYGDLVGAWFASHPRIQEADVMVEDRTHPSTRHLPDQPWTRTDEWYDYKAVPNPLVTILARLDTSTYEGHKMGTNHPIAWHHSRFGGRAFYTGGGHTSEAYKEPSFRQHLAGAILWAAGRAN